MSPQNLPLRLVISLLACSAIAAPLPAGSLEPDAPPGPTMKTLDQVKPQTPISSLPAGPDAVHVISQPGAYFLDAPFPALPGKHAILVDANDVYIDLSGFTLPGHPEALSAIRTQPEAAIANLTVTNGAFRDWPENGIHATNAARIRLSHLAAFDNQGSGFHLGNDAHVTHCLAAGNTWYGFEVEDNGFIEHCVSRGNNFGGYRLFSGGIIQHCLAEQNATIGIGVEYECRVANNSCSYNGIGIGLTGNNLVEHNNLTANLNRGISVEFQGANRIQENHVTCIGSTGIYLGPNTSQNLVVRNSVVGAATGYDISPPNAHGPIVNAGLTGNLADIPEANHPWANFYFPIP